RPGRSHLDALAIGVDLFADGREWWVTADLQSAFNRVPLDRLLKVLRHYLPDDGVVDLVKRILSNAGEPGLRQGGSLSPLLLNLSLPRGRDRRWRKEPAALPLVRYADDVLVACRTRREAANAYLYLCRLLRPAGMLLNEPIEEAVRSLTPESPAVWLG